MEKVTDQVTARSASTLEPNGFRLQAFTLPHGIFAAGVFPLDTFRDGLRRDAQSPCRSAAARSHRAHDRRSARDEPAMIMRRPIVAVRGSHAVEIRGGYDAT